MVTPCQLIVSGSGSLMLPTSRSAACAAAAKPASASAHTITLFTITPPVRKQNARSRLRQFPELQASEPMLYITGNSMRVLCHTSANGQQPAAEPQAGKGRFGEE